MVEKKGQPTSRLVPYYLMIVPIKGGSCGESWIRKKKIKKRERSRHKKRSGPHATVGEECHVAVM